MPLRFALHLGRFAWPGGGLALTLRRVGTVAEQVGLDTISLMDHVVQIPAWAPSGRTCPTAPPPVATSSWSMPSSSSRCCGAGFADVHRSGERRTLRLVARHADACNLFGSPPEVRHKIEVLRSHCEAEGRDPADVLVTQPSEAAVMVPGGDRYLPVVGTVEEQIGRFRELADAGVQQVFVALHEDGSTEQLERFAPVIDAFR